MSALEEAVAESAEPIVLDVWLADHPIPHFLDPVAEAVASFTRTHPGYEIRLRAVPFRDLPGEVARAVEQGNPPDLAEYYFTATQVALDTRAANGQPLFTPIQRAIGERTKILGEPVVVDDLVPAVRAYYSRGDELLSMPTNVSTAILFANQDMLTRAGVDRMPRTWRELEAACAAVARLPDGPAHRITWANHGWMFQMEVAAQGGLLGDNDNGRSGRATRVTLNSPEMMNYVRWWQRMHARGHYRHTGEPRDWLAGMEAFQRQEVAFVVSSSAVGLMIADMAASAGFSLSTGVLPHNGDVPYAGQLLGGQSLFLTAGLPREKEDGALAFTQHLLNPYHAVKRQYAGSLPLTVPAQSQLAAEGFFDQHPYFRAGAEQVAASNLTPAASGAMIGDLNRIHNTLTAAIHDVLTTRPDPAPRFLAATQEAQALLDHYNAACLANPPTTPDALEAG
ncbi:extracellular solute-binding protein [Actinophytocola sp.]|uniref:extracellular solute-binding protein n=1 Tax=Actinophytocola sp. TaxID=1872138 RepID=UPI002ED07053